MPEHIESTYEAACRRATTDQGLDPVVAYLTEQGIQHTVDQTGGFTMVVFCRRPGTERSVGITSSDEDRGYLVGGYVGENWEEEGGVELADGVAVTDLPALISEWFAPPAAMVSDVAIWDYDEEADRFGCPEPGCSFSNCVERPDRRPQGPLRGPRRSDQGDVRGPGRPHPMGPPPRGLRGHRHRRDRRGR